MIFSVQSPIRKLWNGATTGFEAAKDTLSISDPSLWTGELFKEVPDIGADLISVQVDHDANRVLIVRISVKLGNERSVILRPDKTMKRTPAESASIQVRDLYRKAKEVEARISAAAAVSHPGFAVELCHALVTVRQVSAATAEVLSTNGVALWGRSIMASRWIPAVVAAARDNEQLENYRPAAKAVASAGCPGGAGGPGL